MKRNPNSVLFSRGCDVIVTESHPLLGLGKGVLGLVNN